uniref:WRKY transcription factor 46 n=2 Tax=Cajanus cajan TaxID=3821 RepID=A0A151SMM0_CAJCA|nr:putative WRKY transcription factor 46 [Cajanus cajan]
MDSACSFANGSPRSEVMEPEVKHKDVFKKRKTTPKWTEQVKVCLGTSLDDGYSWRKYGQKDILGAKFPRGYYRCTYRNVQGCLATKQVQKSDEDPMICEITYKGRHTCTQASHLNKAVVAPTSKTNMGLGENKHHNHQKNQPQEEKIEPQETIFSFGSSGLEVKTEDLDHKKDIFPSFCFSSPSIGSEKEDNNMFSYAMIENNNLMESFLIAPTTSEEPNIFCLSPCHWGSSTGLGQSMHASESDITDIVSAPTSVTNSPIMDLDFILAKIDFDTDFPINAPELCS